MLGVNYDRRRDGRVTRRGLFGSAVALLVARWLPKKAPPLTPDDLFARFMDAAHADTALQAGAVNWRLFDSTVHVLPIRRPDGSITWLRASDPRFDLEA